MPKRQNDKKWSMLLACGVLSTGTAFAAPTEMSSPAPVQQTSQQTATCSGVIYDELGEPMIGATVRVVGADKSVNTDIDGNFSIAGVPVGSELEVTYVGYQPMKVKWNGGPMRIDMATTSKALDEVVVMGYGIAQKRAKVTNSIAKVSEETLTIGANANPAQALAGAVAGVKVNITSGDPGAAPSVVIRGGTTLDGTGSPVIVVDGQIRDSMSDINPNDIGDMQILKDAGATALYGARAANGVILITTKQGQSGKASVNFNVKYGLSYYDTGYDYADAGTYLYWYRRGVGNTPWFSNRASFFQSGNFYGIGATRPEDNPNYNVLTMTEENKYLLNQGWQTMEDPLEDPDGKHRTIIYKDSDVLKENTNRPATTQDYNVSFSGGNDKGRYYASLGYYDAEGGLKTTYYKRYNFALNGSYKITNWLESNSTFNYTRANLLAEPAAIGSKDNLSYYFGRVASMPHTIRTKDDNGNPIFVNSGNNSFPNANFSMDADKYERFKQSDKFQMTQSFTVTPLEGLSIRGTMSWYYNENYYESFTGDYLQNATTFNTSRSTSDQFDRTLNQTYNLVANYTKTFKDVHYINAMLGMEYFNSDMRGFSASGYGAPTGFFQNLALTSKDSRNMSSYHNQERILSYMGRLEYDYDNKYLVAATFREDGYSRLIDNRWGFFPGVSAGWVFSRENFYTENDFLRTYLTYGKLRASYGVNGVVSGIKLYELQGAYAGVKYDGDYGYYLSTLPNPGLRWERTNTFEVGLDLGILNDRVQLGLTYYNRLTSDKYATRYLPTSTGWTTGVTTNNGKLRNQGVEIDVNATIFRNRDWRWTLGANITYNKNKVVELPDNGLPNNRINGTEVYTGNGNETMFIGGYQEGQEPMHLIGYSKKQYAQSQEQLNAMGNYIDMAGFGSAAYTYANEEGRQRLLSMGYNDNQIRALEPGDVIWNDRNGDNMIDTKDQFDLGNRLAHWTGGFNTAVSWKGLQLYARFDMGFDFTVYDGFFGWAMGCAQGAYNMMDEVKDTWTPENTGAKWPRYTWATYVGGAHDNWTRTNSFLAQSGAYLACRELSLSYQLPQNICDKFYCKGLTVSITGQNLGYIKSCTNPLPDLTQYTNSSTGGSGGTYNLPRQVLFGLNVTF